MAQLIKYDLFKEYVIEILENTAKLEEDIRWTTAYLKKGNTEKNFTKLSKKKIEYVVDKLESLDLGQYEHVLSIENYENLRKIGEIRAFISSKMFLTFINNQDFDKSLEYKNACETIIKYNEIYKNLLKPLKEFRTKITDEVLRCANL